MLIFNNLDMDLIKEAEQYAKNLFSEHKNELLLFHNMAYVKKTIDFAKQLCELEQVAETERENILTAAWLFSCGFLYDYIDYKKQSVRIAQEFLESKNLEKQRINDIINIIKSVLHNKEHDNICAEILYDASEFYLAAEDFMLWVKYHRQERNYFLTPKLTKRSFWQTVQNFLYDHRYCTASARKLFNTDKEKNEAKIKFVLSQELLKELPVNNHMLIEEMREEITQINSKVEKRLSSARGFDTLYRITSRNQVSLSGIADHKSNIMISLNTLIVSAVITLVFLKHSDSQILIIPSFIAILSSFISMTYAVLAIRPQIRPGIFKMDDFYEKKVSLIFYGNFFKMKYDDYEKAMMDMLKDQDLLLSNLNMDQYTLGKILGRKFQLLNISFTVFLLGFIISALAFAIALFFFSPGYL